MKKIGFIDYYISNWHANNYPNWIKEICENTGKEYEVSYMWAELDVSPVDGKTTDEWCSEFNVEKCSSINEVCEKSDYIVILAPGTPEKHLCYAKEVFKYKKNTYIDKTFSSDYKEAKEMFDLAKEYGTKFFSTSALRYADELSEIEGAKAIITTGGGRSIDEYIVHQAEMIRKVMASKPLAVKVENQGSQCIARVKFEGSKEATMLYASSFAFSVCGDLGDKTVFKNATSPFFKHLMADILNFFETGEASFDTNETLDVMKIREAVLKGTKVTDNWIEL